MREFYWDLILLSFFKIFGILEIHAQQKSKDFENESFLLAKMLTELSPRAIFFLQLSQAFIFISKLYHWRT